MIHWLKTLTGCLCVLTVLMHLIPGGKFSGYVRFYGGLLFFLVAAGPLWKLLAGEGEFERLLQLAFLRDSCYDLESSVAGMADLKNEQIREAYRSELIRQVREIAASYGIAASEIQIVFDGEEEYRITDISFSARVVPDDAESALQDPEAAEYGALTSRESGTEAVRRELAGVYMLDMAHIQVRREEAG